MQWWSARNSPASSDLQQTVVPCLKCKDSLSHSDTGGKDCFSDAAADLFALCWGPDPISPRAQGAVS